MNILNLVSVMNNFLAPDFGIPKTSKAIVNFINTEIDPSGSILIEDSNWQEGH